MGDPFLRSSGLLIRPTDKAYMLCRYGSAASPSPHCQEPVRRVIGKLDIEIQVMIDDQRARYREAAERLEPFEQLARVVIMSRAKLGLSRRDLAKRMGTTPAVMSRIESGQHRTSTETIQRLAQALDGQAIFAFDPEHRAKPKREIVAPLVMRRSAGGPTTAIKAP